MTQWNKVEMAHRRAEAQTFMQEWFLKNETSQHVQKMCLDYDFSQCFVQSLEEVNNIYLFLKKHPYVFSKYLFYWLMTSSYKY